MECNHQRWENIYIFKNIRKGIKQLTALIGSKYVLRGGGQLGALKIQVTILPELSD